MRGNLALQRERPPEFDRTRDQASALQRAWSITRRTRLMRSHRVPEAGVAIGHFAFSLNCASGARARHAVRTPRHQGRDGCAAASASRLSRRRSFLLHAHDLEATTARWSAGSLTSPSARAGPPCRGGISRTRFHRAPSTTRPVEPSSQRLLFSPMHSLGVEKALIGSAGGLPLGYP